MKYPIDRLFGAYTVKKYLEAQKQRMSENGIGGDGRNFCVWVSEWVNKWGRAKLKKIESREKVFDIKFSSAKVNSRLFIKSKDLGAYVFGKVWPISWQIP